MRNTMDLANSNPNNKLADQHKLTADLQDFGELLSAAKVLLSQLDATYLPPEMTATKDRLKAVVKKVDIAPKNKKGS